MYYGRSKSNFPVAHLKRRMKKVVGTCLDRSFYEVYQSLNLIRKKKNQTTFSQRRDKWHRQTHIYPLKQTLQRDNLNDFPVPFWNIHASLCLKCLWSQEIIQNSKRERLGPGALSTAERSYPESKVKGSQEKPPRIRGQGQWPVGATQGAVAAWAQEGLVEPTDLEGQEGLGKEIPLVQGKEQWLCFAGAAMKWYPTPKVRETQVRW